MNTSSTEIKNRGWTVTSAALCINLVLGVLYAWGVVAKAIVGQWGWSKAQVSLPFTVSTIAFAITMIFAGRAQDKFGPRVVAIIGGLILGGGLIASGFSQNPTVLVLTFGVIGGCGIGLGYSATTPPSVKWFPPAKKGLIAGIVVAGVGLAAVYISPLAQWLIAAKGIENTFIYLGVGAIVVISIFSLFLQNPPVGYKPLSAPAPVAPPVQEPATQDGKRILFYASPATSASPLVNRDRSWREMLATPQFWQLWLMFILAASAGLMIIAHAAIIAKEQAHLAWGFMPIVLLAIFNTAGRIVGGYVSDRIGRTQTMVLAFLLQAVNMFLFAKYQTPGMLLFGAAFTGLCYGTIYTLMPMAIADFYGLKNLGLNYGILFTAFGFAGVVGPIVGGIIRDRSGTYNTSYTVSAILLLVAAALAYLTKAPKQEETPVEEKAPELVGNK